MPATLRNSKSELPEGVLECSLVTPVLHPASGLLRAVGYTRVSTAEQAEHGYGLPVQAQRIVDFAREERHELAHVFEDGGVRGALPLAEREGLRAALEYVRERRDDPVPVSAVIVARFDRLGRDALESLLAEREFARLGATVLYAEGLNGEDPQTKFMRHLMHGMAELDKDMLVSRLAAGRRAKRAAGLYAGGRPRLGFRPEGDVLVPCRDAKGELEGPARVIAWMFMRVAKDRWTTRRVAVALNERHALGVKWDAARVSRILVCEDYKRGSRPIVDPRVWNKAQQVLASRRRGGPVAQAA